MRREELLEEKKLLGAKSWFARSVSSGALQHGSVEAASDGYSSRSFKEGGVEGGAGFTPLRQLSMRRSRPSGEIDKEAGVGSPSSMTSRNVTPLTPLTPLRWKSNPALQEELEKAKIMERSTLGPPVSVATSNEGHSGGKSAAEDVKDEEVAERQQEGVPVAGTALNGRTKLIDELATKGQAGIVEENTNLESVDNPDRKTSAEGDVMTMTIEFLRARLLSERSASKAAKLRVQQLAKKVSELEQKLEQAVEDRKKAEVSAQQALLKLKLAESSNQATDKTAGETRDRATSTPFKGSPRTTRLRAGREEAKFLQQDGSSNGELSRSDSNVSSVEIGDLSTKKQSSENAIKIEESAAEGVEASRTEKSQGSSGKPESRAAIEERLRNMWNKISEEMAALAEERSQEDVERKELMNWMSQVPAVFQDIIPKKLVSPVHDVHLNPKKEEVGRKDVPEHSPQQHSGLDTEGPSPDSVQDKGELEADARKAALLHENFAAQESVQREWERNYYESQQKLEQFTGDYPQVNGVPNGHGRAREHQHADYRHEPKDVADGLSYLGQHHGRLAKSKSSSDFLPIKSNGYAAELNASQHGVYGDSDSWSRERSGRQENDSRHHESQKTLGHRLMSLDHMHLNHSRMHQERPPAPSMLHGTGHEAFSARQLEQDTDPYYQHAANRGSRQAIFPPYSERRLHDGSYGVPTNRSSEDGYRSSHSDYRTGQTQWDDGDRRSIGRHEQAQPMYGDTNIRTERDAYSRDVEKEEPYSSQPERRPRHEHPRSLSDSFNYPVEDYNIPNPPPEPSPGLERRQSYSGYPATNGPEPLRTSFDTVHGSYEDLRLGNDKSYGGAEQKRDSYAATKVDNGFGHSYPPQSCRNGYTKAEPQLSLGYGPAYDAPKEDSPMQQSPKAGINKNISDVLRALQLAKANIQSGNTEKISYSSTYEQRLSGEYALPAVKTGFGLEAPSPYMQTSRQSNPDQLRYTENREHSDGPVGSKFLRSPTRNVKYDPYDSDLGRERYQSENDVIPGTNGNGSYVDQLNVGNGIQFFFT